MIKLAEQLSGEDDDDSDKDIDDHDDDGDGTYGSEDITKQLPQQEEPENPDDQDPDKIKIHE